MTGADLPMLDDPAVPASTMLGPDAAELLRVPFAGVEAELLRTVPTGATYHPGSSLTVRHDATVAWPDGTQSTERVVMSAGRRPPRGALAVSDGTHDIVVWRGAADPWLPGLAVALDPRQVVSLLEPLGVPSVEVQCRQRAYRPGRRAVVKVSGPGVRVFLKVVRPHKAEALHRRHELLSEHAPVPRSLGWSDELGIVVLQALRGRTLRDALRTDAQLPAARDFVSLLDSLPAPAGEPSRRPWRGDEFATHLTAIAPELEARLLTLTTALAPFEREAESEPPVAVHGDFYEAQILVDGPAVIGLLDVDTFGWGRRVDDYATLIGHLAVLGEVFVDPQHRGRVQAHARDVLDHLDRLVDPALLRAGTAAVILGLATGSFRVLEPRWREKTERRVALAEAWMASAIAVREKGLTAVSRAPQG